MIWKTAHQSGYILRATAHAADPKDKTWWPEVVTCMTLSTPYEKCMSPSRPYGKSKWHGEGGHLHSYWARRSDVLGLSSHMQIYVHKGLYNTNLCTQRLVYINIIMCMCTCAYVYLDSWQCSKHFASSFVILMRQTTWPPGKEPLKTMKCVPQPLRNFSHQAKPKKAASGAHPKRQKRCFWNP